MNKWFDWIPFELSLSAMEWIMGVISLILMLSGMVVGAFEEPKIQPSLPDKASIIISQDMNPPVPTVPFEGDVIYPND